MTGRSVVALAGSSPAAWPGTSSGAISPRRAWSWAAVIACLTVAAPRRPTASVNGGCASSVSVRGIRRRLSTTAL